MVSFKNAVVPNVSKGAILGCIDYWNRSLASCHGSTPAQGVNIAGRMMTGASSIRPSGILAAPPIVLTPPVTASSSSSRKTAMSQLPCG